MARKKKEAKKEKIQKKGGETQKKVFELRPTGNMILKGGPAVCYTAYPRGKRGEYWD